MQLSGVFCYALLSITISSVCAHNEEKNLQDIKSNRKLRREATVFIDSLPAERIHHNTKIIYRRTSKNRYQHPKLNNQYRPPRQFGPKKTPKKPNNKYTERVSSKYPINKKTSNRSRFRIPPPQRVAKPTYIPPIKKKIPQRTIYHHPEAIGFAEPPKYHKNINSFKPGLEFGDFIIPISHSQLTKHGHGEPPVDSYGAPIEANLHDLASSTIQAYTQSAEESENSFKIWRNNPNTKKEPVYKTKTAEPKPEIFVTPVPEEDKDEQDLNSYSDIFNYRYNSEKKKTKPSYVNHVKIKNKPWKMYKYSSKIEDSYHENIDDDIVGGQYAEPPARHVIKHQEAIHGYHDDTDFDDTDFLSSATNSPYMNYKNSNVAFSPQNLNDAFSIVD